MSTPQFDTGLRLDQLRSDRGTPVETPWGIYAIYLTDGVPRASQAFCPHLEAPIFEGTVSQGTITCPWHQWRFDLTTGNCLDAPGLDTCDAQLHCLQIATDSGGNLLVGP